MEMRYLYGDSVPFPLKYDFLHLLDAFVTASTRALKLDAEARALSIESRESAAARIKGVEQLETFHQAVMRTLQETAGRMTQPHTLQYARAVAEHAAQIVDEHKRTALMTNERESSAAQHEAERRREEARAAVEGFLRMARFFALSKVSMRLDDAGKHGFTATFTTREGVTAAFALQPTDDWLAPRRVGDFAKNLDMMVGIKKSWFKGTVTPDMVHIDDHIISRFDVSEDMCEVRLRKKVDQKDNLVFRVRRLEGETVAEVGHPGDPNAGSLPPTMEAGDQAHVERLWQALWDAMPPLADRRGHLISLGMEGEDVFVNDKVVDFIRRLVTMFAPIVGEIATHSPNKSELSLKRETDDGRREEIYLRKEDLIAHIEELGEPEREIFAPFGFGNVITL